MAEQGCRGAGLSRILIISSPRGRKGACNEHNSAPAPPPPPNQAHSVLVVPKKSWLGALVPTAAVLGITTLACDGSLHGANTEALLVFATSPFPSLPVSLVPGMDVS